MSLGRGIMKEQLLMQRLREPCGFMLDSQPQLRDFWRACVFITVCNQRLSMEPSMQSESIPSSSHSRYKIISGLVWDRKGSTQCAHVHFAHKFSSLMSTLEKDSASSAPQPLQYWFKHGQPRLASTAEHLHCWESEDLRKGWWLFSSLMREITPAGASSWCLWLLLPSV